MNPAQSKWLVYGESGAPLWLVLLGLAAALYVAHRWLNVERQRRKGWMSRCLPWTLTLILLLLAWVGWRPVFVHNRTWEQPGRILAVVDGSDSMKAPLGCRDLASRLDMLALWHPEAAAGRNQAPSRAAAGVAGAREEAERHGAVLQRLEALEAQGLPLGQADRAAVEAFRTWAVSFRDRILQGLAAVRDAVNGPSAEPEDTRRRVTAGLETYETLLPPLGQALDTGGDGGPPPGATGSALQALLDGQAAAEACLHEAQNLLDQPFRRKQAATLDPWLDEVGGRTRREAALALANLLPAAVATVEPDPGDPRETDAYEALQRALARHEGEVLSHLIWLSDGGHNGGASPAVPDRLRKEGIAFVAVGVGVASPTNVDFAVRDWRAPRVTRAERTIPVTVQVKTPAGLKKPFVLKLSRDGADAARGEWVSDGQAHMDVTLSWKTPAAGRHVMTLAAESPEDALPGNNSVTFAVDTVVKPPELFLAGACPDWDTAYFRQAATRLGLNLTQVFTEDKPPKRGGFGGAVPNTPEQWARFQAVLLRGPPFAGLAEKDVEDLCRYVVEGGNTLVIMPDAGAGYLRLFASRFGWRTSASVLSGALRLGPDARHYPVLKLGPDGAQSARLFAAMGRSERAFAVPPQQVVLVEQGEPVCSLGFYGKGRVVLWGLDGIYRMREFEHAERVNRLLDAMLGDWVTPLSAPGADTPGAFYPALPAAGVPALLVVPRAGATNILVEGVNPAAVLQAGVSNTLARVVATGVAVTGRVDGRVVAAAVADNPGMERLDPEFDEAFLRRLARDADGQYAWAPDAVDVLKSLQPRTYRTASADVYPVGRSPYVLALLVALATLHWVFRKLSGMAI